MKKTVKQLFLFTIALVCNIGIWNYASANEKNESTPYGGKPRPIPGRIEAENFDEGGEGVAYHDFEAANLAGQYRLSEGVEPMNISSGGGKKVGYIRNGEWLNYTVDVKASEKYILKLRMGTPFSSSKVWVEVNGEDKTGKLQIPNTGNFENWQTIAVDIELQAGEQKMRLNFETNDNYVGDIDWFEVVDSTTAARDKFWSDLETKRVESDSSIVWTQVAPGNSGFANLMRYHPTIPGRVVQCPDMLNLYQSNNNGTSWYNIKDPDGNGEMTHVRDLYYSQSNPELGLAVEMSQVWISQDTGKFWSIVPNCPWYVLDSDGTDREGWKNKVASLAIDPNDKNTWFVGGGSNARGQEWLSCYKDATAANPRGSSHVNQGKLWRTNDFGTTWKLVNSGLDSKVQIGRIIVNPKNSNQVFVSSQYGVYRSDDEGTTWNQITEGKLDNNIIMDMDFYFNSEDSSFVLYVIDQVQYHSNGNTTRNSGGIFKSDDEGETWTNITGNLYIDINRLTGGVSNSYYKYIAMWFGINENQAKTTYPVLPQNALQVFNMISTDPSRKGALYIGFADPQIANSFTPGRVWTTANDGEEWINTARLYAPAWERDKAYWQERGNPYNKNMVVGHQSPAQQWGTDYPLRSARGMDVGVDGSVMIIVDHSTMLSTDYGETWNQVDEDYTPDGNIMGRGNSNLPGETLLQDKRLDKILLGSGEHHLWIPTDDGKDGRQALKYVNSIQETVSAMATDPYDSDIVYSTSFRQQYKENVFRSTDGGLNWKLYGRATPVSSSIWGEDMRTHALTVDPIDENIIYFGVTQYTNKDKFDGKNGFYFSNNRGKSFKTRNNGLPHNARIQDILIDPRDSTRASIFAAAEKCTFNQDIPQADGGLYHTTNHGENWTKIKMPASVEGATHLVLDHTNRMYVTTGYRGGGSGVWYTDDFGETWHQTFKYAGAECVDVSPFDHNLLVVTVDFLAKNPGLYFSRDRGETWTKSNKDIGIPHRIRDVEFDVHDASQLWMATVGCGFYKGAIENGESVQVVEVSPKSVDYEMGVDRQLSAEIINPEFAGENIIWKSVNNGIATIDENGRFTPHSRGKVKIWATTEDGRYSDYCVLVVHDPTTSSEAVKIDREIKVYPNPANRLIHIENIHVNDRLVIHNISGQKLKELVGETTIDISNLVQGIYVVKVYSGNKISTTKFVKK